MSGKDFAQQHLAEQHLPEEQLHPFTLLIGMLTFLFSGLKDLTR